MCVAPGHVDADGLLAQRALLDELARKAGREPAEIDTVLRVNVEAGTGTTQVADAVRLVHERTGIEHFMVDSMYTVDTVEESVAYAREILGRTAKG